MPDDFKRRPDSFALMTEETAAALLLGLLAVLMILDALGAFQ